MKSIIKEVSKYNNQADFCNYSTSPEISPWEQLVRYCRNEQIKLLATIQQARAFQFLSLFLAIFTLASFANPTKINANTVPVVGPYTVTFNGATYGSNTTTFSYDVYLSGTPQGNGLSHLIFSLDNCDKTNLGFSDVISATIDGKSYNNISGSEGNGTGCDDVQSVPDGKIIKFDDLPGSISEGTHTFTFTLPGILDVASGTTWVKAGNACYAGSIPGPGCPKPNPCDLKLELKAPPIACYNGTTTITATASGSNATLEYSLNGGSYGSANTFVVGAGKYTICVREKNNTSCYKCEDITIGQPDKIDFTFYYPPIKCYGDKTTLTVTIANASNYEFSLDGGAYQSSNVFYKVAAGEHSVCVRPKSSSAPVTNCSTCPPPTNDKCVVCKKITIEQPTKIDFTTYYPPIKCYGDKTTLTITASGGSGDYQYSINNGATYQSSNVFNNVVAGTYTICVKDKYGCCICKTVKIEQPAKIYTTTYYHPIKCYGDKTTLKITASGGTAPYQYSINGGSTYQSSNKFENLKAGTYNVCVRDYKGCVQCKQVTIEQPNPIAIYPKYDKIKYYGGTTTLKIVASGGTAPYKYSINNGKSYQSSNVFKKVKAGTYWVCVMDKNGCCQCIKVVIKPPKKGCNCNSNEAETNPLARVGLPAEEEATETLSEDRLVVSPNPYSVKADVEFSLIKESAFNLQVVDSKGATVKHLGSGNTKAGKLNRYELDSSLPVGSYIVILSTPNGKKTFRVIRE